jgi:hypothetical protein
VENSGLQGTPDPQPSAASGTGRWTPDERADLRLRSAEARAVAKVATARYAALVIECQRGFLRAKELRDQVDAARQELRGTVSRYADLLKQLDTPPEQTLRLVKNMVDESTPRAAESFDVMSDVVRWCIEAYYGDAPAA